MRGPPAWPLRLLLRRGAAARSPEPRALWTHPAFARPGGAHPAALAGRWAARAPRRWAGGGPGGPAGGAGLARLLALWARPPGLSRCWALAGPVASRPPRPALPGCSTLVARAAGEAWRRGPALPAAAATPSHDPLLRPAAARRSEAQKLLSLAQPERRRLAGRALLSVTGDLTRARSEAGERGTEGAAGGLGPLESVKRTWASSLQVRTECACCSGVGPQVRGQSVAYYASGEASPYYSRQVRFAFTLPAFSSDLGWLVVFTLSVKLIVDSRRPIL